jgi:hypothetical protein
MAAADAADFPGSAARVVAAREVVAQEQVARARAAARALVGAVAPPPAEGLAAALAEARAARLRPQRRGR